MTLLQVATRYDVRGDDVDLIDDARARPARAASLYEAVAPGWRLAVTAWADGTAHVSLTAERFGFFTFNGGQPRWVVPFSTQARAEWHMGDATAAGDVVWRHASGAMSRAAEAAFDLLWAAHATRTPDGLYVLDAAPQRRTRTRGRQARATAKRR